MASPLTRPGPIALTFSGPPPTIGPTVNWKGLPVSIENNDDDDDDDDDDDADADDDDGDDDDIALRWQPQVKCSKCEKKTQDAS